VVVLKGVTDAKETYIRILHPTERSSVEIYWTRNFQANTADHSNCTVLAGPEKNL